jgi:hypothetical protein
VSPRLGASHPLLLLALSFALLAALVGFTGANFTSSAENPGNNITAATDFRAPTVSASVIAKAAGGVPGFIKQGGSYRIYATVSDTGNPASGIATVTANVSNLTTGQTAAAMSAGSFTIGGVTYNYRSAPVTANATLTAGSTAYSIASTDNASNSGTTNFSVIVDNILPIASDVQTANGSTIVGQAQQNDTITFTFSEPIEPDSILSGWSGASTNVAVEIQHGLLSLGNDGLRVFDSTDSTVLPFGTVDLGRNDYVNGLLGAILKFGASGTLSTMTMSGNTVTIVLGNRTVVGVLASANTAGSNGTMSWASTTTPIDRAGNASTGNTATESGTADKEF